MRRYITILAVTAVLGAAAFAAVAGDKPADQAFEELMAELTTLGQDARRAGQAGSQQQLMAIFTQIEAKLVAFRESYPETPEAAQAAFQMGTLKASLASMTQSQEDHAAAIRYLSEYVMKAPAAEDRRSVATAHYYLAESYKAMGKFDEAKHEYKVVINEFGDINPQMTQFAQTNLADIDVQRQLSVGSEPIAFTVKSLTGETLSPAQYKGKVLLIDFWATWCAPCKVEMPNVKRVYDKYKDKGFEIVGISLDRSRASLDQYIQSNGIRWPQYFDGKYWNNDIAQQYGVRSIPATYLIDRTGKIRYKSLRGQQLESAIEKLIAEKI